MENPKYVRKLSAERLTRGACNMEKESFERNCDLIVLSSQRMRDVGMVSDAIRMIRDACLRRRRRVERGGGEKRRRCPSDASLPDLGKDGWQTVCEWMSVDSQRAMACVSKEMRNVVKECLVCRLGRDMDLADAMHVSHTRRDETILILEPWCTTMGEERVTLRRIRERCRLRNVRILYPDQDERICLLQGVECVKHRTTVVLDRCGARRTLLSMSEGKRPRLPRSAQALAVCLPSLSENRNLEVAIAPVRSMWMDSYACRDMLRRERIPWVEERESGALVFHSPDDAA